MKKRYSLLYVVLCSFLVHSSFLTTSVIAEENDNSGEEFVLSEETEAPEEGDQEVISENESGSSGYGAELDRVESEEEIPESILQESGTLYKVRFDSNGSSLWTNDGKEAKYWTWYSRWNFGADDPVYNPYSTGHINWNSGTTANAGLEVPDGKAFLGWSTSLEDAEKGIVKYGRRQDILVNRYGDLTEDLNLWAAWGDGYRVWCSYSYSSGGAGFTSYFQTDVVKGQAIDDTWDINVPGKKLIGWSLTESGQVEYTKLSDIVPDHDTEIFPVFSDADQTDACKTFGFCSYNGKEYWYEDGVRQGTVDDPKGVIGDGTNRGREIYDGETNAWYWLDSVYDGAKAVGKEVWMPYIYQDEKNWMNDTKRMNDTVQAINSYSEAGGPTSDMGEQVRQMILSGKGKWVRYDENGKMMKGWVTIDTPELIALYPAQKGFTYFYDYMTGLMAKGWTTIGGERHYFDEISGVMKQ